MLAQAPCLTPRTAAPTAPQDWTALLADRLTASTRPDGGWGYGPSRSAAPEPTALAVLALARRPETADAVRRGLEWLAEQQRPDGAVPLSPTATHVTWPTALAAVAWIRAGSAGTLAGEQDSTMRDGDPTHAQAARRAIDWLIRSRGQTTRHDRRISDHDPSIVGWSWTPGTQSWVEPTAWAVLALRAAGQGAHVRAREGVRLLLDRALPQGGWNYGNTRVLANVLRPFPDNTGLALTALRGQPPGPPIQAAIDYLRRELPGIRAPYSLGWAVIGLRAWGALPEDADDWLAQAAAHVSGGDLDVSGAALLLLAAAQPCPLILEGAAG